MASRNRLSRSRTGVEAHIGGGKGRTQILVEHQNEPHHRTKSVGKSALRGTLSVNATPQLDYESDAEAKAGRREGGPRPATQTEAIFVVRTRFSIAAYNTLMTGLNSAHPKLPRPRRTAAMAVDPPSMIRR